MSLGEIKIGQRSTVLTVFPFAVLLAILVTVDLSGAAFALLAFVLLPILVLITLRPTINRFQFFIATRLTPGFYSRRLLWVLRIACGRQNLAWAINSYAVTLWIDGRYEDSIEAFSRSINLVSDSADYWGNRGGARYSRGDHKNAIGDLSIALRIDSMHQYSLVCRGYALMAIEEYSSALNDLAKVACDAPEHYMIASCRGHLHELLHHWPQAIEDYELACALSSTETAARVAIARLQAGCPDESVRNATAALSNASSVCAQLNWEDWIAISVLGAAYSEANDFENAVKYARMALELAPEQEKPERLQRIAQYLNQQPFRIPNTSPTTGRPCAEIATSPGVPPKL